MFKLMGKEIITILSSQNFLIWTYAHREVLLLIKNSTGLQFYGGHGSLSHDFMISKAVDPSFLVVKKSHFNKKKSSYGLQISCQYSKTCLKQPLKVRQNKDLNNKW